MGLEAVLAAAFFAALNKMVWKATERPTGGKGA